MKAAVIGIGSNSLRLLVSDVHNQQINVVLRQREGLRVFASLDTRHRISNEMMHKACESVLRLKHAAEAQGAEIIRLFATSAVRDAQNKTIFAETLLQNTGLSLEICSGELEAKLSFLGAVGKSYAGMIDIGGGSTEIVIGDPDAIRFARSLQAGAVRMYREIPVHSWEDVQNVVDAVNKLLKPHLPEIKKLKTPPEWVGVGGTMTAAATSIQDIPWDTRDSIHGFIAEPSKLRRVLEMLADLSPQQRRLVRSIPPDRSDIIVHGFAILLACMETLRIDTIKVSQHTNLDGYLQMITAGE